MQTNRNAVRLDLNAKEHINDLVAQRIMAVANLPAGARSLEIGCGGAELSDKLAKLYGLDSIGIEPFPIYEPTIGRDRVTHGVAEHLPFATDTFDLVILKDVLEHVDVVQQALDEAIRVSRRYVYIMNPNYQYPYEAHFKVPYVPFMPRVLAKPYLRLFGFSSEEVQFIDHINYVTKRSLFRNIRRSCHAQDLFAAVNLQEAKDLRRSGLISHLRHALWNSKVEILLIKRGEPAVASAASEASCIGLSNHNAGHA